MKVRVIHFQNLSTECWMVQGWGLKYCQTCKSQRYKELWREKDKRNRSKHLRQESPHRLMSKD